jgi:peptide/nickel transport system ATP-binding protein
MAERDPPLLGVRDLCVAYGDALAVDRVSFDLWAGECLGLAGESGSGKSTLAHALARTLPAPAVIRGGQVDLAGTDLLRASAKEMQRLRWAEIAIVFQSAMNALNPVLTIGAQIADAIHAHQTSSRREARSRARDVLALVGLHEHCVDEYPHQLSGGMRQRAVIAVALALRPKLLILDEPTTALDVITQKSLLDRLTALRRELGFALILVTHDLPLLFDFADRVLVMYAGRLAEAGTATSLRDRAHHPYTAALLRSIPELSADAGLPVGIPGSPPLLAAMPSGCRFHPRCERADATCARLAPLVEAFPEGVCACHHPLP